MSVLYYDRKVEKIKPLGGAIAIPILLRKHRGDINKLIRDGFHAGAIA